MSIGTLNPDTGLDYFVVDRVHTLADTEQFVHRDLDWIQSRIIFTTITVLGHRIGLFCGGLCAYFSRYRTICVSGLGLGITVLGHQIGFCCGLC